ncbi:hypothetical protein CBR_g40904 [Chara braunii]|uniref:Uncharacterized protein n=1 Tax=Chara braunii TaxID=69332 RepID=A0A388K2C2_CHABU|nr:hypothetical protein CBR_g40904 [Chara braunii]|eukprot:GBG64204.1 hypothetical protein CBR_g40904 [Chara braunii]
MAARIRSGNPGNGGTSGILSAPAQGGSATSMSNAIVPYQAPQSNGGNDRNYNGGFNSGYNRGNRNFNNGYNGGYNNGNRYRRGWSGREHEHDDRVDKIYGLLSEQAEEREERKREAARLVSLEEEKKRLQAEEEKRVEAKREREQQEIRLGQIVRTNVQAVCEFALGRKVDLPGEGESEINKLRKEIDELKSKCAENSKQANLEVLRKEKEALQKVQDQGSEEEKLQREIDELRARCGQQQGQCSLDKDRMVALQLQVDELNGLRKALVDKCSELASLKKENTQIRGEFKELKD